MLVFWCNILVVLFVLIANKSQVLLTFRKSLEIGNERTDSIIPKNLVEFRSTANYHWK